MAETEESEMKNENNVSSNVTYTDTEAEPQEDLVPKRGNLFFFHRFGFGLGLKSQTPTRQW